MNARAAKQRGFPDRIAKVPGTRARLTREVTTGQMRIPASAAGVITHASNWSLITFEGGACSCCGVRPRVTRLTVFDLEPIREAQP